ncbi:large ribosomal subunit protein uL3m [Halyomorpha halys]|uniref:large ribosomal subunit protein uL3m n=1 Tax=Halyomorpha halys TaxID=286706 RepID=UPI0006D4D4BF|nr:39S ribosomal protein L3, mitochondrial [Halyomorpha halys]
MARVIPSRLFNFIGSKIQFYGCIPKDSCNLPIVTALGQSFQIRERRPPTPKLRFPLWFLKKERVQYDESLTSDNKNFIKEVSHDKFGPPAIISGLSTYDTPSPLKDQPLIKGEWTKKTRRCGLITRKIGCYPMWDVKGKIIWSTLLQVVDNHVVSFIPPENNNSGRRRRRQTEKPSTLGALLVGAESSDPQKYTKEYCGLFAGAGLPPKRILSKFFISPNANIQPGTPLYATHFQPGDVIDAAGFTIYRGFQGVMKRWGFKGMPKTHGVTKTHRRGGNIGGGGGKARVWPGTKMPGHMGNKRRIIKGLKIWRINTKYNVLYVQGLSIPGETNSVVTVYDTILPLRKRKEAPAHFPTFYPSDLDDPLPEDLYEKNVHQFDAPTITFEDSK